METGICTVMRVLDFGPRMCREKVHAEARSRGATRINTKSTKGTKMGARGKGGKKSLGAFCSLWGTTLSASPRLRVPFLAKQAAVLAMPVFPGQPCAFAGMTRFL